MSGNQFLGRLPTIDRWARSAPSLAKRRTPSNLSEPAVDVDFDPGDVGSILRSQKCHSPASATISLAKPSMASCPLPDSCPSLPLISLVSVFGFTLDGNNFAARLDISYNTALCVLSMGSRRSKEYLMQVMLKPWLKHLAFAFGMTGRKTCACGRVWELVKHKTRETDSESVECKCGRTLKRWSGACFWIPRLVRDIAEDK